MRIQVVYFSGTGCTEYVAHTIANEFQAREHTTTCCKLKTYDNHNCQTDLLVICFVVHACNAPTPVMKWVKNQEKVNKIPVVIVSVSGGGEVTPNLACRIPLKKILKKKNYQIIYEKMIVMPSNWIIETKEVLSSKLIQVLPYKVSFMVQEILNGQERFTHPLLGNRILTQVSKLEHIGSKYFGRKIEITDTCIGCGKCTQHCPVDNIQLQESKPTFGSDCIMCLNCIYSCSQKALTPKVGKFVVIKTGFDFKKLLQKPRNNEEIDLEIEAKGYIWLGVKRYLSNTADTLEPMYKKSD